MNRITHEGAHALAIALASNQSLIHLNLSSGVEAGNNRNRISEKGANYLADVLQRNYFIQFLDLGGNCLGNEGIRRLLGSIARANTVQVLKLDNNEITPAGCLSLQNFLL